MPFSSDELLSVLDDPVGSTVQRILARATSRASVETLPAPVIPRDVRRQIESIPGFRLRFPKPKGFGPRRDDADRLYESLLDSALKSSAKDFAAAARVARHGVSRRFVRPPFLPRLPESQKPLSLTELSRMDKVRQDRIAAMSRNIATTLGPVKDNKVLTALSRGVTDMMQNFQDMVDSVDLLAGAGGAKSRMAARPMRDYLQAIRESRNPTESGYKGAVGWIADGALQAVRMLPALAATAAVEAASGGTATALGGTASAVSFASRAAATAYWTTQIQPQVSTRFMEAGMTPEQATTWSLPVSMASAAVEVLQFKQLIPKEEREVARRSVAQAIAASVTRRISETTKEIAEEGYQEIIEGAIPHILNDKSLPQALKNTLVDGLSAAAQSVPSMLVLMAPGGLADIRVSARNAQAANALLDLEDRAREVEKAYKEAETVETPEEPTPEPPPEPEPKPAPPQEPPPAPSEEPKLEQAEPAKEPFEIEQKRRDLKDKEAKIKRFRDDLPEQEEKLRQLEERLNDVEPGFDKELSDEERSSREDEADALRAQIEELQAQLDQDKSIVNDTLIGKHADLISIRLLQDGFSIDDERRALTGTIYLEVSRGDEGPISVRISDHEQPQEGGFRIRDDGSGERAGASDVSIVIDDLEKGVDVEKALEDVREGFSRFLKELGKIKPVVEPEPAPAPSEPEKKPEPKPSEEPKPSPPAPEPTPPEKPEKRRDESKLTPRQALAGRARDSIVQTGAISPFEIRRHADELLGKDKDLSGHERADATEAGLALAIAENAEDSEFRKSIGSSDANQSLDDFKRYLTNLGDATANLGRTFGRRSLEQIQRQQFSTPPVLAALVARAANVSKGDLAVEPSAGTGLLAAYAAASGAKVTANEIGDARSELLDFLGKNGVIDRLTKSDALTLHAVHPELFGRADQVVMNPPFSAVGQGVKKKGLDFDHIRAALQLLKPGGRLVAIVGGGREGVRPAIDAFLQDIGETHTARAVLSADPKIYKPMGTVFPVKMLVIDNTGPQGDTPVIRNTDTSPRGLADAIEEIRDEPGRRAKPSPSSTGGRGPGGTGGGPGGAAAGGNRGGRRPGDVGPRPDVGGDRGREGTPAPERPGAPVGGGRSGLGGDERALPGQDGETVGEEPADDGRQVPPEEREGDTGAPGLLAPEQRPDGNGPEKTGGVPSEPGPERSGGDQGRLKRTVSEKVFTPYEAPQQVSEIEGLGKVRGEIVESSSMAATQAPAISPEALDALKAVVGKLAPESLNHAQGESVARAIDSFEKLIEIEEGQERQGFLIGDGTGVGKTRQALALARHVMDKTGHGAVFFMPPRLFNNYIEDGVKMGFQKSDFTDFARLSKIQEGRKGNLPLGEIPKGKIALVSYNWLSVKGNATVLEKAIPANFEGLFVLDESQRARNTGTEEKEASKTAEAMLALQKRAPRAHVAYMSATALTDVREFAYMSRLGLWGKGRGFDGPQEFVSTLQSAGLSSVEKASADLKASGRMVARSITWDGVKVRTKNHKLTKTEKNAYQAFVDVWDSVIEAIGQALKMNQAGGQAKRRANGQLWGTQLRTFLQLQQFFTIDSVIEEARAAVAKGEAAVIQLVTTMGTELDRQRKATNAAEDIAVSPAGGIINFLDRSFPVQMHEVQIRNGRRVSVPMTRIDPETGKRVPVINPAAVALREEIKSRIPPIFQVSPIDRLKNELGRDNVLELTGRSAEMLEEPAEGGGVTRKVLRRTSKIVAQEYQEFLDDKRRIAIISTAGAEGFNLHAGLQFKNQRQRRHILMEPAFETIKTVQGLGRTNRLFQASKPELVLIRLPEIPATNRLISAAAAKLSQLGAATRGERRAAAGEIFSQKDNLAGPAASLAVKATYRSFGVPLEKALRLKAADAKKEIKRFLNRLFLLPIEAQAEVWDAFDSAHERFIQDLDEQGRLDKGVSVLRATSVKVLNRQQVFADEQTGAKAEAIELEAKVPVRIIDQAAILARVSGQRTTRFGLVRSKRSRNVYVAVQNQADVHETKNLTLLPLNTEKSSQRNSTRNVFEKDQYWETILDSKDGKTPNDFRKALESQIKAMPKTSAEREFFVVGYTLPIFRRLGVKFPKIVRFSLDGAPALGIEIPEKRVPDIRRQFKIQKTLEKVGFETLARDILGGKKVVDLTNGWTLFRTSIGGRNRIQLLGPFGHDASSLERKGVEVVFEGASPKFYLPANVKDATKIIRSLQDERGIAQVMDLTVDDDRADLDSRYDANDIQAVQEGKVVFRHPLTGIEIREARAPWARTRAETEVGRKTLDVIAQDEKRQEFKIGFRYIAERLADAVGVRILYGKAGVRAQANGHYQSLGTFEHVIRLKSDNFGDMLHEIGHAMDRVLRHEDVRWYKEWGADLVALSQMRDSRASAETPVEGFAEWVRRYVSAPGTIDTRLLHGIENAIALYEPEFLAALRDSHRAFIAHMDRGRDSVFRVREPVRKRYVWAKLKSGLKRLLGALYGRKASLQVNVIDAVYRQIVKSERGMLSMGQKFWDSIAGINSRGQKIARAMRERIKFSPADPVQVQDAMNKMPYLMAKGLNPSAKGAKGEIIVPKLAQFRVKFRSKAAQEMLDRLERAGFRVREALNTPVGAYFQVHHQSFGDIKHKVKQSEWVAFTKWAQQRAELERYTIHQREVAEGKRKVAIPYPNSDFEPPAKRRRVLARLEAENPHWVVLADEVTAFFDDMLILPYLNGELSGEEILRIKGRWEYYWPLLRDTSFRSDGMPTGSGGALEKGGPSSNVRAAFGSELPVKSIEEAASFRLGSALHSYFYNELGASLVRFGKVVGNDPDIPFDAKVLAQRFLIRIRPDTRLAATLSDQEMRAILAEQLTREKAEGAGIPAGKNVPYDAVKAALSERKLENYIVQPGDVELMLPGTPIFRKGNPRAHFVIRLWAGGGRHAFFQVTDPWLIDIFSNGLSPSSFWKTVGQYTRAYFRPFADLYVRNIIFPIGNVPRDAFNAYFRHDSLTEMIPFVGTALGFLESLKGRKQGRTIKEQMQLLSNTVHSGVSDKKRGPILTWLGQATRMPSPPENVDGYGAYQLERGERIVLAPISIVNNVTSGHFVGEVTEVAPRQRAATIAAKRGLSSVTQGRVASEITGDFGDPSTIGALDAIAPGFGFIRAHLRIQWGIAQKLTDPDPKVRLVAFAKLPFLAAFGAAKALAVVALAKAFYDPEDYEQFLDEYRDRRDFDRLGWMHVPGGIRIPFGNDILGGMVSYGFNSVMEWLTDDPRGMEPKIEMLRKNLLSTGQILDAWLPLPLQLYVDLSSNYSSYFHDEIVPAWMAVSEKNPALRAYSDTPEIYKWLAQTPLGRISALQSPIKIEYAARQLLSAIGADLVRVLDRWAAGRKVGLLDLPPLSRVFRKAPIGSRSYPVQRISDLNADFLQIRSALEKAVVEGGDVETFAGQAVKLEGFHEAYLGLIRPLYRKISAIRRERPGDERERIDRLNIQMTSQAKRMLDWAQGRTGMPEVVRKRLAKKHEKQLRALSSRPPKRRKGEDADLFRARVRSYRRRVAMAKAMLAATREKKTEK